MKSPLRGSTVAEETDRHLVGPAHLDRESDARRGGQAPADDAGGADDALAEIRDVHRAALALAVAVRPAVQLGKHVLHVTALGDHVVMTAVRAGDVVILAQSGTDAHRHRFLSLRQVQKPGDLAGLEVLFGPVLKTSDQPHAPVHAQQLFPRQILGRSLIWMFLVRYLFAHHSLIHSFFLRRNARVGTIRSITRIEAIRLA